MGKRRATKQVCAWYVKNIRAGERKNKTANWISFYFSIPMRWSGTVTSNILAISSYLSLPLLIDKWWLLPSSSFLPRIVSIRPSVRPSIVVRTDTEYRVPSPALLCLALLFSFFFIPSSCRVTRFFSSNQWVEPVLVGSVFPVVISHLIALYWTGMRRPNIVMLGTSFNKKKIRSVINLVAKAVMINAIYLSACRVSLFTIHRGLCSLCFKSESVELVERQWENGRVVLKSRNGENKDGLSQSGPFLTGCCIDPVLLLMLYNGLESKKKERKRLQEKEERKRTLWHCPRYLLVSSEWAAALVAAHPFILSLTPPPFSVSLYSSLVPVTLATFPHYCVFSCFCLLKWDEEQVPIFAFPNGQLRPSTRSYLRVSFVLLSFPSVAF